MSILLSGDFHANADNELFCINKDTLINKYGQDQYDTIKYHIILGGALSIDKEFREPNKTWWEQEYWSETEKNDIFHLLKKNSKFDYVLSHTGPSRINETIKPLQRLGLIPMFFDEVAALNEKIDCKINCKQWFCGHWHIDKYYYDPNLKRGYQYLYRTTALLQSDKIIPPLSGDDKE